MISNRYYILLFALLITLVQCKKEESQPVIPEIRFASNRTAFENASNASFDFEIVLNEATDKTVTVIYETADITATEPEDYSSSAGTITFSPGETSKVISVSIIVDQYLEGDEQFKVVLSSPVNGYLKDNFQEAIGTIKNDDTILLIEDEGYSSADSYPGRVLVWSDEFQEDQINSTNWTYDLGGGGWGNQELQTYTASSENSFISEGKLVIMAREAGGSYTSARLKSIGLQEFQFGRIDIRAKLPVDQGIWPAVWMLGANFPSVGWPACGEIDIVELVGSNPRRVHGTIHFGNDPGQHQYTGQGVSIPFPNTFADEFHVFSIEWEENAIRWLLDDEEYFSITPSNMNGQNYPFNQEFFFIMNIAVGGEWPGPPTENTTFPEFMAVDYVRVFQ